MRVPLPFAHRLKRMMPKSLFTRALLILLMPMVILQLVVIVIFYDRHWDSVIRNLSNTTALNVETIVDEYLRLRDEQSIEQALANTKRISSKLGVDTKLEINGNTVVVSQTGQHEYPALYRELSRALSHAFMLENEEPSDVLLTIALDDGMMLLRIPKKRVASSTTYLFVIWMVGSALLLTVIATLFLRSQIRPIVQLARAAEQFGLGRDVTQFSPRGASEVRKAGQAFLVMAERIKRQVDTRTKMLAGISHDLRTPLTRMTLEIEMANIDTKNKEALSDDIKEMQHMIDEYLDFTRCDHEETAEEFELEAELSDIAQNYQRQHGALSYVPGKPLTLNTKRQALRRVMQNLIDNALRYGKHAELSYQVKRGKLLIEVRDYGPGIAKESLDEVFRPFTRLEGSRNIKTGGAGLGLAIAQDAAQNLGGDILLENIVDAVGAVEGLRATIELPLQS